MLTDWTDPFLFSIGPLQVRWFGVLVVLGIVCASFLLRFFAKTGFWSLDKKNTNHFLVILLAGMIVGARAGYVFLYAPTYYTSNILEAFAIWRGGLSFYGALGAMALITWLYARKKNIIFFHLSDPLVVVGALGIFFGRFGNFINGELYGRVTDSWVGISFPGGGPFPRHPSQLYEAFMEGALLFCLLYWMARRQAKPGYTTALFFIGFSLIHFILQFFREPDMQSGQFFIYFTLGQLLSVLTLVFGFMVWKNASSAPVGSS